MKNARSQEEKQMNLMLLKVQGSNQDPSAQCRSHQCNKNELSGVGALFFDQGMEKDELMF